VLDGDVMRKKFWPSLGNVPKDREVNCIRLAAIAGMLVEQGADVVVACVSPDLHVRKAIKENLEKIGKCFIVHVTCEEQRKKLWPGTEYEGGDADFWIQTDDMPPHQCALRVVDELLRRPPRALFVGRYQPFHEGHETIMLDALKDGPIAVGVRETEPGEDNPYSVDVRIKAIREFFQGLDVLVFVIPDIHSIHVGRDVGYKVHRAVPGVSGSAIRAEGKKEGSK
jgi:hypothetical protein